MKKVALLLANGFEMYEAAVFSDVLGFANTGGAEILVETIALHDTLTCTYNFSVIPEKIYPGVDVAGYAALAIPGGRRDAGFLKDAYSENFLKIIAEFHIQNKIIAGVCMGVMPIAKTGILKGKPATTYPGKRREELNEMGVKVKDQLMVISDKVITSSSPAAGLEVAFTLLELLTDMQTLQATKKAFGITP